jgi:hypothetical protein
MSPASQVLAQECFYPKANGPHISKQSIKDDRFSGLIKSEAAICKSHPTRQAGTRSFLFSFVF